MTWKSEDSEIGLHDEQRWVQLRRSLFLNLRGKVCGGIGGQGEIMRGKRDQGKSGRGGSQCRAKGATGVHRGVSSWGCVLRRKGGGGRAGVREMLHRVRTYVGGVGRAAGRIACGWNLQAREEHNKEEGGQIRGREQRTQIHPGTKNIERPNITELQDASNPEEVHS